MQSIFTASMRVLKPIILFALLTICQSLMAQTPFSIATDLSILRDFTKDQSITALGQTVRGEYHFKPKSTVYALINYYTKGNFKNTLTATAKDITTNPQTIPYEVASTIRYRQVSVGWKQYFIGSAITEGNWNLYGSAGFGLVAAKVVNTFDLPVDTTTYHIEPRAIEGNGDFIRLSLDLVAGGEIKVASTIFLYAEARTWIPASSNTSRYLYNDNAPRVAILSGGIRILFD